MSTAQKFFETASAAWPGVEVAPAVVWDRLTATGRESAHVDFFLACACLHGNAAALVILEQRFLDKVPEYLATLRSAAGFASDVRSAVRDRILPPPGGREGKLVEYHGDGALGAWLRVVSMRVALNLRRKKPPTGDATGVEGVDLDRDLLKAKFQPLLREHLSEALSRLEPRQRALLRMYIFDNLTFEEMGRAYSVNRSTVHRWMTEATQHMLAFVRKRLVDDAGIREHELDSLLGDLRSRLGFSLQGLRDDQ
jgi:RNA polymerase sigma-70 factor (ECF subfamily)